MDKEQFKDFVKLLKAVYTSEKFLPDAPAVAVWYSMLSDIPYNVAILSAKKYISTEKFPPTIADIRKIASEITDTETALWADAWREVISAIRRYGSYEPHKALKSMRDLTKQVVESIGYLDICNANNDEISVIRGQFRMAYEALVRQKQEEKALPQSIKKELYKIMQAELEKPRDRNLLGG